MATSKPELPPIEVTIRDDMGNPVSSAYVRTTYAYSGLSSDSRSAEDGTASVPLLYCEKEPMRVDAVARGYQAETVGEYRPDREDYKLPLMLSSLKSEWEQTVIPLQSARKNGSIQHPSLGTIQVSGSQFQVSKPGHVSVNGSVAPWHPIDLGKDYDVLLRDGTELTMRFLEWNHGFSLTLECSPPKQHRCVP